jgi:FkbM family methyltransferase
VSRRWARWGKKLAAAAGLRVRRLQPENRFDAMRDALRMLAERGYEPRVIIDAGANVGNWTKLAVSVFPDAHFHVIEPQPACHDALNRLAVERLDLHRLALTRAGVSSVELGGAGTTGAWIADGNSGDVAATITCPATTLDALLGGAVQAADRALLKLDLEGHEVEALQGAADLLERVEVVLTEVAFWDLNHTGVVHFEEVWDRLRSAGFTLYDIAGLAGRRRDQRLMMGDVIFVRSGTPLVADAAWR